MQGSKIKLHRQTAMTPGHEQGALLVARCASSTCRIEAQEMDGLDHPVESFPEPCVSRVSHMVDVHPLDFFALGLAKMGARTQAGR